MLRNDVDHLATLRAEYRDQNKAGVVAHHRSDPLLATCGSRQPVAADVVVEAGPNALLICAGASCQAAVAVLLVDVGGR